MKWGSTIILAFAIGKALRIAFIKLSHRETPTRQVPPRKT